MQLAEEDHIVSTQRFTKCKGLLTSPFLQRSSSDQLSSVNTLPLGQSGLLNTAAHEDTMTTRLTFASLQAFNTFSVPVTAGAITCSYKQASNRLLEYH